MSTWKLGGRSLVVEEEENPHYKPHQTPERWFLPRSLENNRTRSIPSGHTVLDGRCDSQRRSIRWRIKSNGKLHLFHKIKISHSYLAMEEGN